MKQTAVFIFMIFLCVEAFAQEPYYDNDEIQTIFSNRRSNGGYGAISMGYSKIDGKDAIVSGVKGAFIFDHSFALGLAGYGFVNNLEYDYRHMDNSLTMAGGYGGLLLEPIVEGRSPVHVSFPIIVGLGGVSLFETSGWGYWDPYYDFNNFEYDVFFIVEPAVELEFNMARFFRLGASASYRFTSSIELYETPSHVLNGFNFALTFKFGKF